MGETIEYITRKKVELTDPQYFCDRSWTVSFNMNTKSWISFHSYIPNWYIGENNFFYSGINNCVTDFDFVAGFDFVAAEIIPNPTTTTTSSSSTTTSTSSSTTTSTTSSTTSTTSTSSTTTTTTTYTCRRPYGLTIYNFITGFELTTPPVTFVSTDSQEDACYAISVIGSEDPSNVTITSIPVETTSVIIGAYVYEANGTTDCTYIPDGWYFTEDMYYENSVFHVVSGRIVEITSCEVTTTTTTSSSTSTSTTTTTTTIFAPVDCGEPVIYEGGENYPTTRTITLGSDTGVCIFEYNSYSIPDRFIVTWDGTVQIDTGYLGDTKYDYGESSRDIFTTSLTGLQDPITTNTYPDAATYPDDGYPRVGTSIGVDSFTKSAGSPTTATVEIYDPMGGNAWKFLLYCPGVTTTTTSSSSSTTSTTSTSSSTTTTTTTATPYYRYSISNITYVNGPYVCLSALDSPSTTVYAAYPIGSLLGNQLYLNSGLTIPYSGIDGYHRIYEYPPANRYWLRTSSGLVTDLGMC